MTRCVLHSLRAKLVLGVHQHNCAMASEVQLLAASAYLSGALLERGLLSRLARRLLRLAIGCFDKVSSRNAPGCLTFLSTIRSQNIPQVASVTFLLEIDRTRENDRIVEGLSG